MINIANQPEWYIDDNGISLLTTAGDHIIDLRNDCAVKSVDLENQTLVATLERNATFTKQTQIKVGSILHLIVSNIKNVDDMSKLVLEPPCDFEGIYDYSGDSLNFCIGEGCYLVRGKSLAVSLKKED